MKKANQNLAIKFLTFGLLFSVTILTYTLVRNFKDSFIISQFVWEGIPTFKSYSFWTSLGLFVLFFAFFRQSRLGLFFYSFSALFLIIYASLQFVIFPSIDTYSQDQQWLFYSVFYVSSDLIGPVLIALLFWVTANQAFSVRQASLAYPLFAVFGGLGSLPVAFINYESFSLYIIIGTLFMIGLYFLIDKTYNFAEEKVETAEPQQSLSFGSQMLILFFILLLALSYLVVEDLVSFVWKGAIRSAYSDPMLYNRFMGLFAQSSGKISIIFILSLVWCVWAFGWRVCALVTPIITAILASVFFSTYLFPDYFNSFAMKYDISPIELTVYAGAVFMITKGVLLGVFFRPTKEMAYIPLASSMKGRGKALIDFILGGKVLAAGIVAFVLTSTASTKIQDATSTIAVIVFLSIIIWFSAIWGIFKYNPDLKKSQPAPNDNPVSMKEAVTT